MKPIVIIARVILVGLFWSILFLEGIRVIMLTNWHFDIFSSYHWEYAWRLWLSGWVIDDIKEWAFILIILAFIPLWLSGWAALSMIPWELHFAKLSASPLKIFNKLFETQIKEITNKASVKVVKKKKSYKEIRPRSLHPMSDGGSYSPKPATRTKQTLSYPPATPSAPASRPIAEPSKFNHSLFDLDDTPDFDFDLFDEKSNDTPHSPKKESSSSDKNEPRTKNNPSSKKTNHSDAPQSTPKGFSNSTLDVLNQKGYDVITGVTIKNTLIDFIGVSSTQICLCLNDKEPGDWLADEERFNDEEPLWFSESSHRISPVRKIDIARTILNDKLIESDLNLSIEAFVIEQIGNIINAEDMFEIWDNMKINVTRIDRGTPKEIKLFAKTLEPAESKIAPDKFEKIKKLIRNLA